MIALGLASSLGWEVHQVPLVNFSPDMGTDKVSIIMPSYNVSRFISESIESVIAQTYQNWELLICDDGSTDNSKKIAHDYEALDSRILVINNKYPKGAPGARNSCLDVAGGRYIAFLDADDLWLPSKLDVQIDFMVGNRYSFVYSYHDVISEKGTLLRECFGPKVATRKNMLVSNFIPCLTAMYDSKVLGKVYQPDFRKRNDYALWLKILYSGVVDEAHCLPKVTASYRSNQYGLSSRNKFGLLFYYRQCLTNFTPVSKIGSYFLSICYLSIILVKKMTPSLYNKLVTKF